ncbi:UN93B protein, partial [Tyrannus savana]|nr:UN93B protein [Tyrannus savana]
MEKDPDCCQDGAKMVLGAGLGTEGTETQVRPEVGGWAGLWWPSPRSDSQGHLQLDDFVGAHPDYNEEEEEQKYFRRKRLGIIKNVVAASLAGTLTYGVYLGLLQMQLILHYDETYREVKYSNIQLEDIDHKVLMGINVTPVAALLYTPILIRFLGTKWAMFLSVGIYALFVSSNYWERYYTLVPSAVAIGVVIVPLWASMGNYITRMAQKYYEYVNYKEEQEKEQAPRDACNTYIIVFQTIFYSCFHLSFVCAQLPMVFFLNNYLYQLNHTLSTVKHCGTLSHGMLPGFNKTVLQSLPRSVNLIVVESALMAAAFLAMLVVSARPGGWGWCWAGRGQRLTLGARQVLVLCGAAYRPMEEIDMRSIGWGNIFQLPFKHMRDYRLQHLLPLFIYSGFEVLFVCTGFSLNYGVCTLGLEKLAYLLMAYGFSASACSSLALSMLRLRRHIPLLAGAVIHAGLLVMLFCWAPEPRQQAQAPLLYAVAALWGTGSALNKTGISILLGMLYKNKERQDFIFTIYHWWQALAIFAVYLWSGLPMKAKLSMLLLTLVVAVGTYLWMERKLARRVEYRLPRLPRPRHKSCGYRYLEEDDSDETGSEGDGDQQDGRESPAGAAHGDEEPREDGEQLG